MIKERKRTYTQEEVNELKKWFDSQELPPTMQIDKAAFTPNLKDTVDMLFEQAYVCYENPKMQGGLPPDVGRQGRRLRTRGGIRESKVLF